MSVSGSLCFRCGGTRWERVSETEIRCSECGLGATVTPLTLQGRAPSAPESSSSPDPDRMLERLRQLHDEGPASHFARASFRPHGLDDRWTGLRSFGGWGGSEDVVTSLTLAHGDAPWDPEAPHIRVETRIPAFTAEHALFAQEQLNALYRHTGQLPVEARHAAFAADPETPDPTGPWEHSELTVDGLPTSFRTLAIDTFWVGLAPHAGTLIGIEAQGWARHMTGLVTVHDFTPYEAGSRKIRKHWR